MSRDRDRILEQALKHELRAVATPPGAACLDGETLGAWTDGGLEPSAMATVEAHLSTCTRCQSVIGAMARSTLGTPRTVRTLGTLSSWWLAPIAAGVTAVTLWMVVPEQQQLATAPPQPEIAKPAQAPAAESLPPAAPARAAAADQPTDQPAQRNNRGATAREDRQSTFAEATVDRKEKPGEERKEEAVAVQERAKLADAVAPPAPAAPPPPATATLRAPAELGALQKNALGMVAPPGIEVTHQSAPSDSVCWFVGRAGLVLLTTDAGATFTRVDLGEPLDIASVSATDARIAIITTVSGRRFRTEDGGRAWRPF